MHTFTVSTWADTKSNRRDRTYVVAAAGAVEAKNLAFEMAVRDVRQCVSITTTITDVDGTGAPVDCPHAEAIFHDGYVLRWDGGRECRACRAADEAIEEEAHRTAADNEGA